MNSKRKRPIGVTLIALAFLWIGCDGALFLPIIGLTGGTYGIWQLAFGSTIHSEAWLKIVAHVLDCIWWALYVAYAVIGFGLWKLKSWARKSVLAIAAIAAFGATVAFAVSLVMVRPVSLGVAVFGFALAQFGWLAWYLMRPRVRHAFGAWNLHRSTGDWIEPPGLSKRARAGVGILGAISVAVLFVVPLYFAINKEMRDSDAYKLTMNMAQASPCVVNVLGTPVESGWLMTGSMGESSIKGSAQLSIPVEGPKGKGTLDVEAKKLEGAWKIDSLVFTHGTTRSNLVSTEPSRACR